MNFRNTESFNPCPEKVTAMTTVLWRPSLVDWKMKCSMVLRKIILPLKHFPRPLPITSTITITAESKLKQNGCLPLNSEKHPWWKVNYSILNRCPENWVHIKVQRLFYIDSRFRTLRGRFRQLRTALRRQSPGSLLLLLNRLHRGENASKDSIGIHRASFVSLVPEEETKENYHFTIKFPW